MKFNHLQASISNNANQSPSLYMAFCAVESLFADLEDNCGAELSRCPVGDERLPSKLVWLCRVINEIYSNNDAELQRNRSRLDAAMEKLNETRQELEKSADVYERLENAKAEYAVLEQKLQNSGAAAEEYEKLSEKCRQAKQTPQEGGIAANAKLNTFYSWNTINDRGDSALHTAKHGVAHSGWQAGYGAFNNAANTVTVRMGRSNRSPHFSTAFGADNWKFGTDLFKLRIQRIEVFVKAVSDAENMSTDLNAFLLQPLLA